MARLGAFAEVFNGVPNRVECGLVAETPWNREGVIERGEISEILNCKLFESALSVAEVQASHADSEGDTAEAFDDLADRLSHFVERFGGNGGVGGEAIGGLMLSECADLQLVGGVPPAEAVVGCDQYRSAADRRYVALDV